MKRDQFGILVQTDENDPSYMDGGDSAFATGLMAMTGSWVDIGLMRKFIDDKYRLVRHPMQPPKWTDANETSRDQTIAFYAGLPLLKMLPDHGGDYYIVRKACLIQAGKWFCNKDLLMPDVRLYLYKVADAKVPPLIALFGYPLAFLSLLWNCFVKPDHEQNQAIAINSNLGEWWIKKHLQWHPDLKKNVTDYYSGWRMKKEMGERINGYIDNKTRE